MILQFIPAAQRKQAPKLPPLIGLEDIAAIVGGDGREDHLPLLRILRRLQDREGPWGSAKSIYRLAKLMFRRAQELTIK